MAEIYNLTDLWDNILTHFDAIKMNVTNTASSEGSLLLNLQVDSVSMLRLEANGTLLFGPDAVKGIQSSGANISFFGENTFFSNGGVQIGPFVDSCHINRTSAVSTDAPTYSWSNDKTTGLGRSGEGQVLLIALGKEGLRVESDLNGATGAYVSIPDIATAPVTPPVGRGFMYVEAGALKYMGSSGTVTVIGVA